MISGEPVVRFGPVLGGARTTLLLLEPIQVDVADFHDDLIRLINSAFRTAKSKTDILNDEVRIPLETSFSEHVRTDLGAFVLLVRDSSNSAELLGTVSARCRAIKPTNGDPSHLARGVPLTADAVFSRFDLGHARDPTTVFWEMKLLAVSPSVQRKGLAGWLIDAVEAEIVGRCKQRDKTHQAITHVVVLLTTIRELNGDFYAKRGYCLDGEQRHASGTLGSQGAFTVVHMSKRIPLSQIS